MQLVGFQIAHDGKHKYNALLLVKNRIQKIPFGDIHYQQYHDKIGYYSELDHKDPKRRESFRRRHAKNAIHKYSAGWFAYHYLW